MKRIVKGAVIILLICIGLSACGEKEKVMAPTNLPSEKQEADLLAFLKTFGGEPPVFTKPDLP